MNFKRQTNARYEEFAPDPTGGSQWRSYRRCPRCSFSLATTGRGRFWCERCGYEDTQDVRPLIKAGLAYRAPMHRGFIRKDWMVGA